MLDDCPDILGSKHPETSASCGPVATSSASLSLLVEAENRTTRVRPSRTTRLLSTHFVLSLRVRKKPARIVLTSKGLVQGGRFGGGVAHAYYLVGVGYFGCERWHRRDRIWYFG